MAKTRRSVEATGVEIAGTMWILVVFFGSSIITNVAPLLIKQDIIRNRKGRKRITDWEERLKAATSPAPNKKIYQNATTGNVTAVSIL